MCTNPDGKIRLHIYQRWGEWDHDYVLVVEDMTLIKFLTEKGHGFRMYFDKECTQRVEPSQALLHSVFKTGDCLYQRIPMGG